MISALLGHILNVLLALELANKESSNPCVWYFITFFMDCTLGVFFCYLLMKSCNLIFKRYNIRVQHFNLIEFTKWKLFLYTRKWKTSKTYHSRWLEDLSIIIIALEFICDFLQNYLIWDLRRISESFRAVWKLALLPNHQSRIRTYSSYVYHSYNSKRILCIYQLLIYLLSFGFKII